MNSTASLPRDDSLPSDLPGFLARFSTEASCAELLRRWRYPNGFVYRQQKDARWVDERLDAEIEQRVGFLYALGPEAETTRSRRSSPASGGATSSNGS